MNKQLSCFLLILALFSLNIAPAQAGKRRTKRVKPRSRMQFVIISGKQCFKVPHLGYRCLPR